MENIAFPEVIGSYRKVGGRMAELRKKKSGKSTQHTHPKCLVGPNADVKMPSCQTPHPLLRPVGASMGTDLG